MENRRGIFITNIVSKVFEKLIYNRIENKIKFSKYQCGGRKRRGPIDHIFTVKSIIDYQKRHNKNTYLLFLDAEKCFDKLWLKDCIVDLKEAGVPSLESLILYKMNENISATIMTPVGQTEKVELKNIVKQGRSIYIFLKHWY